MAISLSFHSTASMSARAITNFDNPLGATGFVEITVKDRYGHSSDFTVFFSGDEAGLAKAYADAINSVKVPVAPTEEASQ